MSSRIARDGVWLLLAAAVTFGIANEAAHAQSSSTTLKSSLNPSSFTQPVTFTGIINGSTGGAPTGTLTFNDGISALGAAQAVNTVGASRTLAAGVQFTCAVTVSGGVKCWGLNSDGQLGNGTTTSSNVPVAVSGISDAVAVAAGITHACALTSGGTVKCWGSNITGALGDGTSTSSSTPVDVINLSGVVAISSQSQATHVCALTEAGAVKCWGGNRYGQLGNTNNNYTDNRNPVPADVGLSGVTALAVGYSHTCAVMSNGGIKCWGANFYGQSGNPANNLTNVPNPSPLDVLEAGGFSVVSGAVGISAGIGHSCALFNDAAVRCWGSRYSNALGDGQNPTTYSYWPNDVGGVSAAAIFTGGYQTCAVAQAGTLKCWGSNLSGETTASGTSTSSPPVDVTGLGSVVAMAGGLYHSCVLTAAGGVKCWGWNTSGQVGDGTNTSPRLPPVNVSGMGAGTALTLGKATLTTSALAGGDHAITAVYDGDEAHTGSTSSTLTQTVVQANQTISFTSTAPTSPNVGATYMSAATATSGLTVALGASGACSLAGETVTFIAAGICTVTADQSGNEGYNAAPQATQTIEVLKTTSLVTLDASSGSSSVTQSVTFTASVGGDGGYNIPSGPVSLNFGDGSAAEMPTLASASASAAHAYSAAGTYTITATYGGDDNFAGPVSKTLSLTVNKIDQTVSFSTTAPSSPPVGTTYSPAATATSGLTVTIGASGACSFSASVVSFTGPGECTVTADQAGDTTYNAASQQIQTVTAVKGATTMALSAAPMIAKPGQAVALTATVAVTAPAVATPSGSVTFKEGSKLLGTGAISGVKAKASTSTLTIGSHTITANYTGNSNLTASSATTTVKVNAGIGPETLVNTTTAGAQQTPSVAALTKGYVVTWVSASQDGAGNGIYMQRYNAVGVKAGVETRVNTVTAADQSLPAVAALLDGGFVVVWQSAGEDKSGLGIYGQRFRSNGAKNGAAFKINTTIKSNQSVPKAAALATGGFVVAWTSNAQDGAGLGIYAQLYDTRGKASGGEFKVNKTTAGDQSMPSVGALSNGGFVIAWQTADPAGLGISMQRYSAAGKAQGTETRVNATTVNDQSLPSVVPLDAGGFVIAWQSSLQDGAGSGIYMQRFAATGAKAGGEIRVNTTTVNDQTTPVGTGFNDEGYVILWASKNQDGSGLGIYAQVYSDAGAKVNVEFLVNTTTAGNQSQPSVAAFRDGNFVAVWTSSNQDGGAQGVYAQRLRVPFAN
jgi:alpha-tubulin suppressor-like RCC1 family protein